MAPYRSYGPHLTGSGKMQSQYSMRSRTRLNWGCSFVGTHITFTSLHKQKNLTSSSSRMLARPEDLRPAEMAPRRFTCGRDVQGARSSMSSDGDVDGPNFGSNPKTKQKKGGKIDILRANTRKYHVISRHGSPSINYKYIYIYIVIPLKRRSLEPQVSQPLTVHSWREKNPRDLLWGLLKTSLRIAAPFQAPSIHSFISSPRHEEHPPRTLTRLFRPGEHHPSPPPSSSLPDVPRRLES